MTILFLFFSIIIIIVAAAIIVNNTVRRGTQRRMKRRGTNNEGGGGDKQSRSSGTNSNNNNNKKKRQKQITTTNPPLLPLPPPLPPPGIKTKTAPGITQILPRLLLANIMSYFDPETLRMACLLCKELYDIIYHDPGMEQQVSPLLTISPSSEDDDDNNGRTDKLIQQLYPNRNKLQHIREVTIINGHKFGYRFTADIKKNKSILEQLRLKGVVSLQMLSSSKDVEQSNSLPYTLALILPNLKEVDLSNTIVSPSALVSFSDKCSHLEKITWNNNIDDRAFRVNIDGSEMRNAKNLKEIYMNDFEFVSLLFNDALWDLDNDDYSHIFLFHKCSHVLERVSIKNSKLSFSQSVYIPQNALIKFIRNAPVSLTWFRSDLTPENITMLRMERPEIEFV